MENKETEQKISQLQILEQNLQNFLMQKQQFQSQLIEIDSAINELVDAKKSYKIIGNIMVDANKEVLSEDLKKKKKIVELRIKSLEKEEESIKEKAKRLQNEVISKLKK